jgi:alkanesulfonate monooxygenase SsuD/methylene tetrahydromethanopterin reductase-like flavin-dependent oxidoreductase (luciferase family)
VLLLPFQAGEAPGDDRCAPQRSHAPAHDRGQQPSDEAAAAGVDYAARGRRANEAIDVLRSLWAGHATATSLDGEFYSFENVTRYPKPLQMLPIHVGGSSAAAAHRAGRRGDGFFPAAG